jgi:predicted nuclease of predicted toxin-antitoxin system
VKLLFDENLSPKLVIRLADLFPDSLHVRNVGLQAADDPVVWDYAKNKDLILVSKDVNALRIFNDDLVASFLSLS